MPNDNEKKAGPAPELDMASLEKAPEEKPGGEEKKPAAKKKKKKKLTDGQLSRYMGAAATAVCVAGLGLFVAFQMFSGTGQKADGPGGSQPSQPPVQQPGMDVSQSPGQESAQPEKGSQGGDPFNRIQWSESDDPWKLEGEDGSPAAQEPGAAVQDGTRYWVKDRAGNGVFKILIPAGYTAIDMGDCFSVGMGDFAATGDDPITFFWRKDTDTRNLLEFGYYDKLANSGTTGLKKHAVEANGYYLFADEDGVEWPVVTGLFSREDADGDVDGSYYEYLLVVGKPAGDGRYLVGAIPADSFSTIATQRCPDITSLAKALFPASSEPMWPENWGPPSEMDPSIPVEDMGDGYAPDQGQYGQGQYGQDQGQYGQGQYGQDQQYAPDQGQYDQGQQYAPDQGQYGQDQQQSQPQYQTGQDG